MAHIWERTTAVAAPSSSASPTCPSRPILIERKGSPVGSPVAAGHPLKEAVAVERDDLDIFHTDAA